MALRQTHTYATLAVSVEVYEEIEAKLRKAGYSHAFVDGAIDMHGIGLVLDEQPQSLLIRKLREIGGLFDAGAQFTVGEDDLTIEGRDYGPQEDASLDRVYSVPCEQVEPYDGPAYADTLTPVIEKIKADTLAFASAETLAVDAAVRLEQWQQFAGYCRLCALSGEADPQTFEEFIAYLGKKEVKSDAGNG